MSKFMVGDRVSQIAGTKIGRVIEIGTQCDNECAVKWRDGVIEMYADHELYGPLVNKAARDIFDNKDDLHAIRIAIHTIIECRQHPSQPAALQPAIDNLLVALERLEKRS